jgi:16S rRNA (cytidine1402-2'-O)-methyltransferase
MSTLFIVATPIGNLSDFSFRALETLKQVDLMLSEDTRVTKKLLDHYKIEKPVLSYHQHSKLQKINYILELLDSGKNLALVSDAGTPGISDPGNLLIKEIVEKLGEKVKIIPMPGPSAVTTAASISGFPMDRFLFLGFPPAKRKRKKFFKEVIDSKYPVIFYESPYRIQKTLQELNLEARSNNLEPSVVVARELTKKFETVYRGNISEVIQKIEKDKVLGEFVVVVEADKR